jgi:hypothetical protein
MRCGSRTETHSNSNADEEAIRIATVGPISETVSIRPRPNTRTTAPIPALNIARRHAHFRSRQTSSDATPWWLWWNILSFDAPTVAVVWSLLFARTRGVRLGIAEEIILALSVWLIYISDRLFDGWESENCSELQERHRFCLRHRAALVWIVLLVTLASFYLTATFLPPTEAGAGMKLAAIVGAYMASIHVGHGWLARFVPKEVAVGILFAVGATLPVWSRAAESSWHMLVSITLFALICSLNCLAIECWEGRTPHYGWRKRWYLSAVPNKSWINWIGVGLAAAALTLFLLRRARGLPGSELWAISLAAILIFVINRQAGRFSVPALRVLVDAVLVAAGVIALVNRVWGI